MIIKDDDLKIIKKAEKSTLYKCVKNNKVSYDDIIELINRLNYEIEHWKEEYQEMEHKYYYPEDYEPVKEWWE